MATELESLIHAKGYLDKLANGINPLTDEFLPETDSLMLKLLLPVMQG